MRKGEENVTKIKKWLKLSMTSSIVYKLVP